MAKIIITIDDIGPQLTVEIKKAFKKLEMKNAVKKVFGKRSKVSVQIFAERTLILDQLAQLLFKKPMMNGKPLFAGHMEIIRTYLEKENFSLGAQKTCVSQFFSNVAKNPKMTERIWAAAVVKLHKRDNGNVHLEELREILSRLEPNLEFLM